MLRGIVVAGLVVAFPAAGQNLILNPDFNADTANWALAFGSDWGLAGEDESGSSGSNSVVVDSADNTGVQQGKVRQCINTVGHPLLYFSGRYKGGGDPDVELRFFTGPNCTVSSPAGHVYGLSASENWADMTVEEIDDPNPQSTQSIRIDISGTSPGSSFSMYFDRLYLGPASAVDADDFETGDFARWSFSQTN